LYASDRYGLLITVGDPDPGRVGGIGGDFRFVSLLKEMLMNVSL